MSGIRPETAWDRDRTVVRLPDPAFQVVVLPAHADWMTGALVYCDPFWAHDCVGLRQ